MNPQRIYVLKIPFDPLTTEQFSQKIEQALEQRDPTILITPNPEILLESQRNPDLQNFLQNAHVSIPDGIGVLWAATFLKAVSGQWSVVSVDTPLESLSSSSSGRRGGGFPRKDKRRTFYDQLVTSYWFIKTLSWIIFQPKKIQEVLPERVTGVDSVATIAGIAAKMQKSIFLLGGMPRAAEGTKSVLQKKFPNISNIETLEIRAFTTDDQTAIEKIKIFQPDILLVAFGSPKQELWIQTYRNQLPSVKLFAGIGGSFDFISGKISRAPLWMRKIGLEWLYRLQKQPHTRIRRIWNAVVVFSWKIFREV